MRQAELARKTPLRPNPQKPLRSRKPPKVPNSGPLEPKRPKPKAMPLKTLKLRCDVLWRTHVKRDGKCVLAHTGPCSGALQAAHLVPRSQSARIKYHELNGVPLCVAHHMQLDGKAIGTRHAIAEIDRLFPGRYDTLESLAAVKSSVKRHEWEATLARLKELS